MDRNIKNLFISAENLQRMYGGNSHKNILKINNSNHWNYCPVLLIFSPICDLLVCFVNWLNHIIEQDS